MESIKKLKERIGYYEAGDLLVKAFPRGSKAYTLHVDMDRTGAHHTIIVLGMVGSELMNLSVAVARLMESDYDNVRKGVRCTGGGLDMGHHIVDWLGRALHRDGQAIRQVGL